MGGVISLCLGLSFYGVKNTRGFLPRDRLFLEIKYNLFYSISIFLGGLL